MVTNKSGNDCDSRAVVLIVDDDIDLTKKIYTQYFSKKTHDLILEFSSNGMDALRRIEQRNFSVLVTDIKMPVMDGLTLLRTIRENGIFLPSIVLTGYGTEECRVQARALGAIRVLEKPAKLADIFSSVLEALA
jgi:CheY-like chemotaxis protein